MADRWLPRAGDLAQWALTSELAARARGVDVRDEGHGFDQFGLNRDWVAFALAITRPLYEVYFRVSSYGHEHLADARPGVLAANHSGMLPLDAMMIWADLVRHTDPPWVPRVVIDHFVNLLPFVNILFTRSGAIGGSRGNFHHVLEQGESILVFPEGVPGISKPFRDRYKLQKWREGHAELAIRHQVPIIPIAVIGAEEQWPQLTRLPIRMFGSPFLPIPATPVPLPVHYHIHYGEPIRVDEELDAAAANDPDAVRDTAKRVKVAVQELIDRGLDMRPGVFT